VNVVITNSRCGFNEAALLERPQQYTVLNDIAYTISVVWRYLLQR
jgi:hypothetical protein